MTPCIYCLGDKKKPTPDKRNPRIIFYHLTPGSFSIHCHFLLHFKDATFETRQQVNNFFEVVFDAISYISLSFSDFGLRLNVRLIGVEQLFGLLIRENEKFSMVESEYVVAHNRKTIQN